MIDRGSVVPILGLITPKYFIGRTHRRRESWCVLPLHSLQRSSTQVLTTVLAGFRSFSEFAVPGSRNRLLTSAEHFVDSVCVTHSRYCTYLSAIEMHQCKRRPRKWRLCMDINQAKWFLRVFVHGKKLDTLTIRELYLSGYIGIELLSPGKEPLPTVITEKGKRVLEM